AAPGGARGGGELTRGECRRVGRPPAPPAVSVLLPLVAITDIPLAGPAVRLGARAVVKKEVAQAILAGSAGSIRDRLRAFAGAGPTEVSLSMRPPFDRDLLLRSANEIMPAYTPTHYEALSSFLHPTSAQTK